MNVHRPARGLDNDVSSHLVASELPRNSSGPCLRSSSPGGVIGQAARSTRSRPLRQLLSPKRYCQRTPTAVRENLQFLTRLNL